MHYFAYIASVGIFLAVIGGVRLVFAKSPKHSLDEWRRLSGTIRTLSTENLTEQPPQIRNVLRLVLTNKAGVGNVGAVKSVRQTLALELDIRPRGLRACASATVLFGLCCTVGALAKAFFHVSVANPETLVGAISGVLPSLYIPNTVAIVLALLLTIAQTTIRLNNDRILLAADEAFNQLDAPNDGVDPRFINAMTQSLTQVTRQMQAWQTEMSNSYFQQIRLLLDQVTRVAEGIQSLVKEGLAAAREDDDSVLLAVTTLSRRIESQNQRLDAAIHRLVGPVASGFTGLSGMADVATGLKDVVGTLGSLDLRDPLERVGEAAAAMQASLTSLPKDIEVALSSVGDTWGNNVSTALSGVVESTRTEAARPLNDLRDTLVDKLSEIIRIASSYRDYVHPNAAPSRAPLGRPSYTPVRPIVASGGGRPQSSGEFGAPSSSERTVERAHLSPEPSRLSEPRPTPSAPSPAAPTVLQRDPVRPLAPTASTPPPPSVDGSPRRAAPREPEAHPSNFFRRLFRWGQK